MVTGSGHPVLSPVMARVTPTIFPLQQSIDRAENSGSISLKSGELRDTAHDSRKPRVRQQQLSQQNFVASDKGANGK
ncbi:hypothetical protein [Cupriavidus metallidurans]|uniref:hypothetical protein n=1 Tax=Cupriavidus metallidurans TaxID=119219 RepID=UPI001BFC88E9|nr:hypothetical protein [Cupriavidus metallidurans]QWC91233.1 hypothetical protein KB891_27440 [Cupriavidus metallidurans]